MDIIGKESPTVTGLPCVETWQTVERERDKDTDTEKEPDASNEPEIGFTSMSKYVSKPKKRVQLLSDESEDILKVKKLRLAMEIMEKESYLKTLEILKLERELGLPVSKFTEHLPKNENILYVVENNDSESNLSKNIYNCNVIQSFSTEKQVENQ